MPRTEVFHRDQVICQARDVFWAKGYNGTSMQDLVDATGLNRSSIYNSFGNKMELYKTCLAQYQGGNFEYLEALFNNQNSALEGLKLFFTTTAKQISQDAQGRGCMVVNCSTEMANQDENLEHWLGNNQQRMVTHFKKVLLKAQDQGALDKQKDVTVLASYLVSAIQGLRVSGTVLKDPKILSGMVGHILATLK